MLNFYNSLSEKDRRRYAAIEAKKLGHGGDVYIYKVLGFTNKTIARGKQELLNDLANEGDKIRQSGGGRKSFIDTIENIDDVFLDVIQNNIAGSPMEENIKWTNLSQPAIAERMQEAGVTVSTSVVKKLLQKHDFCFRKAFKVEAGKQNIPDRDDQFNNIERLKGEFSNSNDPVLSMDVKKRS